MFALILLAFAIIAYAITSFVLSKLIRQWQEAYQEQREFESDLIEFITTELGEKIALNPDQASELNQKICLAMLEFNSRYEEEVHSGKNSG